MSSADDQKMTGDLTSGNPAPSDAGRDEDLETAELAVSDAHRSVWGGIGLHTLFCLVIASLFIALFGWTPQLSENPLGTGTGRIAESITGEEGFGALEIVAVLATIAIAATVSRTQMENSLHALDTAARVNTADDHTQSIDLNTAAQLVRVETFAGLMYLFTTVTAGVSLALSVALITATEFIAAITVMLLSLYLILEAGAAKPDSTSTTNAIMQLRNRAVANKSLRSLGKVSSEIPSTERVTNHHAARDAHKETTGTSPTRILTQTRTETGRGHDLSTTRTVTVFWSLVAVALLGTVVADWKLTNDPAVAVRAGLASDGLVLLLVVVLQQLTVLTSLYTVIRKLIARVSSVALVVSVVAVRWSLLVTSDSTTSTLTWALVSTGGFAVIAVMLSSYALGRTGLWFTTFAQIDLRALRSNTAETVRERQRGTTYTSARTTAQFRSAMTIVGSTLMTAAVSIGWVFGVAWIGASPIAATPADWWVWWLVNCVILLAFAYAGSMSEPGMWVLAVAPSALIVLQFVHLNLHAADHNWLWRLLLIPAVALPVAVSVVILWPATWTSLPTLVRLSQFFRRPVATLTFHSAEARRGEFNRLTQRPSGDQYPFEGESTRVRLDGWLTPARRSVDWPET